jgi:hypothetical protein
MRRRILCSFIRNDLGRYWPEGEVNGRRSHVSFQGDKRTRFAKRRETGKE